MDVASLGKLLIWCGVSLAVVGLLLTILPKLPVAQSMWGWVGKLPGDVYVKKGPVSFYFPLATCLLISIMLTLIVSFLKR